MLAPPKPPSHDELEALIKEARERQLRRRLLGAAGAAIAAAIGLSVYAFFTGSSPGNLVQPPANAGRATGPPCRASQLSSTVFFQGATQQMIGGAMLTNTSSTTCSLPIARPAVRVMWRGRNLRVREQPMVRSALLPPWRPARVLAPHAKAQVVMDWRALNWCGKESNPTPRFTLRFRNGLTLAATATGLTLPGCGLRGSILGVSRPLAPR